LIRTRKVRSERVVGSQLDVSFACAHFHGR